MQGSERLIRNTDAGQSDSYPGQRIEVVRLRLEHEPVVVDGVLDAEVAQGLSCPSQLSDGNSGAGREPRRCGIARFGLDQSVWKRLVCHHPGRTLTLVV